MLFFLFSSAIPPALKLTTSHCYDARLLRAVPVTDEVRRAERTGVLLAASLEAESKQHQPPTVTFRSPESAGPEIKGQLAGLGSHQTADRPVLILSIHLLILILASTHAHSPLNTCGHRAVWENSNANQIPSAKFHSLSYSHPCWDGTGHSDLAAGCFRHIELQRPLPGGQGSKPGKRGPC